MVAQFRWMSYREVEFDTVLRKMASAKDRLVCEFRRWCRFNGLPNDFDGRDEDGHFEDGIYQLFLDGYPETSEGFPIDYLKKAEKEKGIGCQKLSNRKYRIYRKKLNSYMLNEPFLGSDGHHITKDLVVYVPKELHRSINHNIWTGKGIKEINLKVKEWLLLVGEANLAEIVEKFAL